MKFKEALNINAKSKIATWYNDYKDDKHKKFLVLIGNSGNGKTFLPTLLAEEAGIGIFLVEPENVSTSDDINNVIKGINSSFGDRLILVDDFHLFKKNIRKKLQDIAKISIYPVIYTSAIWCFDSNFLKGATIVKLQKPLTSELRGLLIKLGADYDLAEKIAKNSKSIRSAIMSLQNKSVNELTKEMQTTYSKLQDLRKRKFDENINRSSIKWIFESIRGYGSSSLQLMLELAEYDYKIMAQFQEIDPFIVNNMSAPVEDVELKYRFRKKDAKGESKIKLREEKKKTKNFATIDDYL